MPGVAVLAAVLSHDDSLTRSQLGSQEILHWKFWAIVGLGSGFEWFTKIINPCEASLPSM